MRFLLIACIAALAALALNAAEVTGVWKGAMETQIGRVDVTITLQSGATLTGRVQAGEYEAPIEKAKVEGDKIHFEAVIQPGRVIYDGTINGAAMNLNVTGTQGDNYMLTCTRQNQATSPIL
jgi:hypothetical protein